MYPLRYRRWPWMSCDGYKTVGCRGEKRPRRDRRRRSDRNHARAHTRVCRTNKRITRTHTHAVHTRTSRLAAHAAVASAAASTAADERGARPLAACAPRRSVAANARRTCPSNARWSLSLRAEKPREQCTRTPLIARMWTVFARIRTRRERYPCA